MKRFLAIVSLLSLVSACSIALLAQEKKAEENSGAITRTYELKYVAPGDVRRALDAYLLNCSYANSSNLLTVTLMSNRLADFEENLRKLDVPKRQIQFRIFTVIASPSGESGPIENPDLKSVLDELKKLLSFRSYRLDGFSTISLLEGSTGASVQLTTLINDMKRPNILQYPQALNLMIEDVRIEGVGDNQSQFRFGFTFGPSARKSGADDWIIVKDTVLKNKGYLVAGVTQQGRNGESLVLVINAEIKK